MESARTRARINLMVSAGARGGMQNDREVAKLKPRYDRFELETLVACVYPEEDRALHTSKPWDGEGFRHFCDPKIVCIEHFWPKPLTAYSSPHWKPAA